MGYCYSVDISFAILSWNSELYVERCINSIHNALKQSGFSYEVRVFDNGSSDQTPELLKQLAYEKPGIVFPYFESKNIGTTKSRNRLIELARGKYLCVMDSDVVLNDGVVETLAETIENDRQLGIVAPRILYPSGAWQKSFDQFPTLLDKINRFIRLRSIEKSESRQLSKITQPFFVDYVISAFWLMRLDLLDKVGPLDERIFYAPEDVDFCFRVWSSGYQILYVPSVTIVHHTQEISRGLKLNRAKFSHLKGLLYYFFKHRYMLRRPRIGASSVVNIPVDGV